MKLPFKLPVPSRPVLIATLAAAQVAALAAAYLAGRRARK